MKRYKLKRWVIPSLYILSISVIVLSLFFMGKMLKNNNPGNENIRLVSDNIVDNPVMPVIKTTNETVNHPYLSDKVTITKAYYDNSKSEEDQINSLIYYKNTYMENTGVLYTADTSFDVVSVLDGTVTSITTDEVLGNVIEITHSTNLITVYECLGEVSVAVGDAVKQNDVIGNSGKVNLDKGYENSLLFEVNYKGEIINPIDFYNMKISEIE